MAFRKETPAIKAKNHLENLIGGINLKMMVNYFASNHSARDGLIYEDHLRMSKDLSKIYKIPFLFNKKELYVSQETSNFYKADLPFRKVKIICNDDYTDDLGFGRLAGYVVKDSICTIFGHSEKDFVSKVEEWYSRGNTRSSQFSIDKEISLTLKQLDSKKYNK